MMTVGYSVAMRMSMLVVMDGMVMIVAVVVKGGDLELAKFVEQIVRHFQGAIENH